MGRKARKVLRVPGLRSEEPLGLGTLLKRATSSLGVRPCFGCGRRAARLDSLVAFGGRPKKEVRPDYS